MKKTEVNTLLQSYIRDHLSPQKGERDTISGRYNELCGFLGGNCFQSGSYARFTSTTPVNDLDVIWVMPKEFVSGSIIQKYGGLIDPNHVDPSGILRDLAKNLEAAYKKAGRQVRIEPQSHSVGVYFGKTDEEFSIDVVPAIVSGEKNDYGDDIYWVPQIAAFSKSRRVQAYAEHEKIDWIKSDPKGYIEDARELNEENENFRKVSKFVRKWRRGCKKQDKDFPLKSFHLELIVNDIFKENPDIDSVTGVQEFFSKANHYIAAPNFVDRADRGKFVDSYIAAIPKPDRNKVFTRLDAANALAKALDDAGSESEALALVQRILSGENTTGLVKSAPAQIALGDYSHREELVEKGIVDHGTYPCSVSIDAHLWFKGPRDKKINRRSRGRIKSNTILPTWHEIDYTAKTDAPLPHRVFWQVVNTGEHARRESGLRGQIFEGNYVQTEHSLYTGKHWIECFIVTEEGVCIARSDPFYVMFRNPQFPLALP